MCLGVPGKIVKIVETSGLLMGKVDFGGIVKEACLAYLDDPQVGEFVLVHVGFALQKIDEVVALETLQTLREMGELDAELGLDAQRSQ
jgi:hydrogenase expression/formation protein HypC